MKNKLVNFLRAVKKHRVAQSFAFLTLSACQFAAAANLGKIAENTSASFNSMGLAAQAFFALCGLILIGMSIFKLIEYNKGNGQAKLSTVAIYLIGGALLFYIASLIQTSGDTVWGDGQGDRSKVTIQ